MITYQGPCPACGRGMAVERYVCDACGTRVEGRFALVPLARLGPQEAAFVELFVRVRGNLKQMERILEVSYPTLRSRLETVIGQLGGPYDPQSSA